jgi:hypothetical protein
MMKRLPWYLLPLAIAAIGSLVVFGGFIALRLAEADCVKCDIPLKKLGIIK